MSPALAGDSLPLSPSLVEYMKSEQYDGKGVCVQWRCSTGRPGEGRKIPRQTARIMRTGIKSVLDPALSLSSAIIGPGAKHVLNTALLFPWGI